MYVGEDGDLDVEIIYRGYQGICVTAVLRPEQ